MLYRDLMGGIRVNRSVYQGQDHGGHASDLLGRQEAVKKELDQQIRSATTS